MNTNENYQLLIQDLTDRMNGAVHSLKTHLNGLRTGRASSSLLDNIKVEVYGSIMPLSQLATVSVPEARMLAIQVWDKNNVHSIEKAILDSGLGLNPLTEGQNIRIPIPNLSQERRIELTKKANEYSENNKISIRNIRRDGVEKLKKMEKNKEISQDELKTYLETVQKLTDKYVNEISQITEKKNEEILAL